MAARCCQTGFSSVNKSESFSTYINLSSKPQSIGRRPTVAEPARCMSSSSDVGRRDERAAPTTRLERSTNSNRATRRNTKTAAPRRRRRPGARRPDVIGCGEERSDNGRSRPTDPLARQRRGSDGSRYLGSARPGSARPTADRRTD